MSARLRVLWRVLLSHGSTAVAAAVNYTDTLSTLDVAYHAHPFVDGPTKASVNLQTLDVAYRGYPFVGYTK